MEAFELKSIPPHDTRPRPKRQGRANDLSLKKASPAERGPKTAPMAPDYAQKRAYKPPIRPG